MNTDSIANFRLLAQQIGHTKFKDAKEVVEWMGAMQAQDFAMSRWAVGIRLPQSTEKQIQESLDRGDIIRTHLLRPTWHLVSAKDIHWMLELTAPNIKTFSKSRWKELELTEEVFKKSNLIIEKFLSYGDHLTREELVNKLNNSKIKTDENRASHIMLRAELDGLVCSGVMKGKQQTYALLDERVSKKTILKREEALSELTFRYFNSHGPATIQDFAWWSGLSGRDTKLGIELTKSQLTSEKLNNQTYYFAFSFSIPKTYKESIYFLPAYDEFIISYKDRSASIDFANQAKAISTNGIFRPVIIVNGKVVGIWSRTIKKNKVMIETTYFQSPAKSLEPKIKNALTQFEDFLNL